MKPIIACATLLLLVGCASTAPAPKVGYEDPAFAAMSRCEQAVEMLGWDGLSYSEKQAIMETARNEGCFGKPQTQEVIVR